MIARSRSKTRSASQRFWMPRFATPGIPVLLPMIAGTGRPPSSNVAAHRAPQGDRLRGWGGRTRTCKRCFHKVVEILGEFSLDYKAFGDERLVAREQLAD
jgi:hypothetical protein